jgi:hypothetical protein
VRSVIFRWLRHERSFLTHCWGPDEIRVLQGGQCSLTVGRFLIPYLRLGTNLSAFSDDQVYSARHVPRPHEFHFGLLLSDHSFKERAFVSLLPRRL